MKKKSTRIWQSVMITLGLGVVASAQGPLRVHPENPRYLTDESGKALWLAGSHTWANFQERGVAGETPDFDYRRYLDFMTAHGHNFMRLWRWEQAQWMQFVPADTLIRYAPMAYPRTGPGLALDGKPKFDLTRFNPTYFERLRRRVVAANQRGIVVSVMMFQGFSVEQKGTPGVDPNKGNAWCGHPFHRENNINGIDGDRNRDNEGGETHTLADRHITALQENYIRQVVDTLNDLDAILWEISNESHTGSIAWHSHLIEFIKSYEADKPKQHLVGMTGSPITNPPMFASPADWISPRGRNYLNDPPDERGRKIIVVDTDHIRPWESEPNWVWKNFMRGNHFILMDHYMDFRMHCPPEPDPRHDPARRAMGLAVKLAESIALASLIPRGDLSSTTYCLADPARTYLVYQPDPGQSFSVTLEPGRYHVTWIDCTTGQHTPAAPMQPRHEPQTFTPAHPVPTVLHLVRSAAADHSPSKGGRFMTDRQTTQPKRMTVDRLEHAEAYLPLHPAFARAFAFLRQEKLARLPLGRHDIDEDRVFAVISREPGRPRSEVKLESHKKYIDIQYIIDGAEEMGWKPTDACHDIAIAYQADADIQFFNDKPATWTVVHPGSFALFFPQDAHAPLVSHGEIHKVVLKIAVEPR